MSLDENYKPLVVAVSARALFDMRDESTIFKTQGEAAYRAHQKQHCKTPLKTGTVFALIQKLMALNEPGKKPRVELVLVTKNDAETGHRVYESIRHYGLAIPRAIMSKGEFEPEALKAYNIDLFLSRNGDNVIATLKAGIAAAQVYDPPADFNNKKPVVHFSFDGDKVLFSAESEKVFQEQGFDAYMKNENALADKPLGTGPFINLLLRLNALKKTYPEDLCPIKVSMVTMRNEIRPLTTFEAWDQYVDTLYMMGRQAADGEKLEKAPLLKAIGADIFFDDSRHHADLAADVVPTGYVPDVPPSAASTLSDTMNKASAKKKTSSKKRKAPKAPKP